MKMCWEYYIREFMDIEQLFFSHIADCKEFDLFFADIDYHKIIFEINIKKTFDYLVEKRELSKKV